MNDARRFFNKDFLYAVVGATTDEQKYGYRVLMDLHSAGWNVAGVNPKHRTIGGVPCYASLKEVQPKPDVAVFVVPSSVGLELLPEAAALGIRKVWFQPGAESAAVQAKIKELGLDDMADGSCIMVARRLAGA